jgi:hypothetical protein
LLVADRIKACLPQSCLNFILTAEAAEPKIVYMCDKIADMVDAYFSTHSFDGKPKVAGYDANRFTPKASVPNNNNKSNTGERTEMTHAYKSESAGSTAVKSLQSTSTQGSARIRSYACHQFGHTRKQCPNRVSQLQTETSRKVVTSARVQACIISDVKGAMPANANANKTGRSAGQVRAVASVGPIAANCSRSGAENNVDDSYLVVLFDDAREPLVRHTEDGERRESPGIVTGETRTPEKGTGRDVSSSSIRSRVFYSSKVANDVNKPGDEYGGVCHTSVMNEKPMSSQLTVDNLAPLQYVRISIDGLDGDIVALHDSGSQINLIRRSLLPEDQRQSVSKIGIRGAFGAPIQTEVVMLAIKPAVLESYEVNIAPAYETLFAVCEELNEQIILTADTVHHLN